MNDRSESANAGYYQSLHDHNRAFLENNWLVPELEVLRGFGGVSLIELGCGNGRFLERAADHWPRVVGVDWARSPNIDRVLDAHPNVEFLQRDVTAGIDAGIFDLVVSADFLEHLAEEHLRPVMRNMLSAGRVNFHKIACYDDGHSHLSILPPDTWLQLWHSVEGGEAMRIASHTNRKGPDKSVIVVTNGPAA